MKMFKSIRKWVYTFTLPKQQAKVNSYWLHISHNVLTKSKRQTLRNGFALIQKRYHRFWTHC